MARVVLGVHFPTDTLIGALMGSGLAFISLEYLLK
jgi:undecaprenyl-diphosphatase